MRLQDLSRKSTKDKISAEEIVDLMVTEQFITTLPQELRVWVTDRKPKTSTEAGQTADEYEQARKSTQETKQVLAIGERNNKDPLQCHTCGKAGHTARDCRMKSIGGQKKSEKEDKEKNGRSELRCFNCGGRGHMSMMCPSKALPVWKSVHIQSGTGVRMVQSAQEQWRGRQLMTLLQNNGAYRLSVTQFSIQCAGVDSVCSW